MICFSMLFDLSDFQVVVFIIPLLNVVISGFNIQHTETAVFEKIESLKKTELYLLVIPSQPFRFHYLVEAVWKIPLVNGMNRYVLPIG